MIEVVGVTDAATVVEGVGVIPEVIDPVPDIVTGGVIDPVPDIVTGAVSEAVPDTETGAVTESVGVKDGVTGIHLKLAVSHV